MIGIIKNDIIAVLSELVGILKAKEDADTARIRELSNHVIHNASVFQDEDSISIAVLIYSLSKVLERNQKKSQQEKNRKKLDYDKFLSSLNYSISGLKKNDEHGFRKSIKDLFDFIREADKRLKLYVYEVINQARIKKGCKLCEHGISIARTSEVMGISQWELMQYLGKTTLIDKFSEHVNASRRLKIARGLFR